MQCYKSSHQTRRPNQALCTGKLHFCRPRVRGWETISDLQSGFGSSVEMIRLYSAPSAKEASVPPPASPIIGFQTKSSSRTISGAIPWKFGALLTGSVNAPADGATPLAGESVPLARMDMILPGTTNSPAGNASHWNGACIFLAATRNSAPVVHRRTARTCIDQMGSAPTIAGTFNQQPEGFIGLYLNETVFQMKVIVLVGNVTVLAKTVTTTAGGGARDAGMATKAWAIPLSLYFSAIYPNQFQEKNPNYETTFFTKEAPGY